MYQCCFLLLHFITEYVINFFSLVRHILCPGYRQNLKVETIWPSNVQMFGKKFTLIIAIEKLPQQGLCWSKTTKRWEPTYKSNYKNTLTYYELLIPYHDFGLKTTANQRLWELLVHVYLVEKLTLTKNKDIHYPTIAIATCIPALRAGGVEISTYFLCWGNTQGASLNGGQLNVYDSSSALTEISNATYFEWMD